MTAEQGPTSKGPEGAVRPTATFRDFVAWLRANLGEEVNPKGLEEVTPLNLFMWGMTAGLPEEVMAEKLSDFCQIPFVSEIAREDVEFKSLPRPFCEAKMVLPVRSVGKRQNLILANPFDWELFEDLERTLPRGRELAILIAAPATIRRLLAGGETAGGVGVVEEAAGVADVEEAVAPKPKKDTVYDPEKDPGKGHPVAKLAVAFLGKAVTQRATDLLVEAKGAGSVARAVVGGEVQDLQDMPAETGRMLVSRFKALAGMDVAKKRTPQTGRMEVRLQDKVYRLRLATSPTQLFEDLAIRVLDPSSEPIPLPELGLSPEQVAALQEMAGLSEGMILVVGASGSGKTTTLCSVLAEGVTQDRSLISVEATVEYRIPFGVQNEVGEDEASSFESLLKDAIGDEPDVLFVGEVDDVVSARACLEFATSRHLVLATMASSNATTAVFRLERLGLSRAGIAEGVIGLVAQKLLKKLCSECKQVQPISEAEAAQLKLHTDHLPMEVAHPVGCSQCKGTGYRGREGVFEVIRVDPQMADRIRDDRPISEIRDFARDRGDLLIGDHGIQKIRDLVFPVQDVYREVLLEEGTPVIAEALGSRSEDFVGLPPDRDDVPSTLMEEASILVVDDDQDTRDLLDRILSRAGYRVIQASDGGEALLKIGSESLDLILSDIHMPSLDGLKLLEIAQLHGLEAPVILLTAEPSPEAEARGREMGAADYLRKPIKKDLLLERIREALNDR